MDIKESIDIHAQLSKKYGVHQKVVSMICNHPFIFAKKVMADKNDERTIMFHYFGKFRIRRRFLGKKKLLIEEALNRRIEKINKLGFDTSNYRELKDDK